jgi:WD40 repeat protein/transcriptional regulator with XRE-family HTH domain
LPEKEVIQVEKNPPWSEKLRRERINRGWSQPDVSEKIGSDPRTVGRWERGESFPSPYLLQKLVELYGKSAEELGLIKEDANTANSGDRSMHHSGVQEDWGEAPDIEHFYGRERELTDIEQWMTSDRCRLIAVLGIGGVGKTTFATLAARSVKDTFEFVFWRSLQHAPSVESILESFLHLVSQQRLNLLQDLDAQISLLLTFLRKHRCLLLLDNIESILQSGQRAGMYRETYEGYSTLFRRVGSASHRSCLMLTSREKPQEVAYMEGSASPARTLLLPGIGHEVGRALLKDKGLFGTDAHWATLVRLYTGNPLALKLVAEPIREVFGGNIAVFLDQEETVFGDINDLLNQQFLRLSDLELEIMYWLAIEREGISLNQLRANMLDLVSRGALLEALDSLRRRAFIETSSDGSFLLQSVIEEFVTKRFVEVIYEEIYAEIPGFLGSHALIKAQSSDYVRSSQVRQILVPLATKLQAIVGKTETEKKLRKLLSLLRKLDYLQTGYAAGNILNLLVQLQANLRGLDFSHLAVRQAYLQDVALPEVNFVRADLATSVFSDTFSTLLCVTISPDGTLLAAGTTTNEVRLWQQPDVTALYTCPGHSDDVRSVAFSPDGLLLASASQDQTVRLWDTVTGRCQKVLRGHTNWVRAVAFSPDGHLVASASEDLTVRFWAATTGECLTVLRGHTSRVRSIAFHPGGAVLASCGDDQTIRLWDTRTGNCLHVLQGHNGLVRTVSFSPDGEILASGGEDHTVRSWDRHTGQCLKILQGHSHRVWTVAFSSDSTVLASSGDDQTIRLWNARTGDYLRNLQGHTNRVWSVVFVPGSKLLVSTGEDDTMRVWETRNGQCIRTLQGRSNLIKSIAFSPDGQMLASGSEDQMVRLWDSNTGNCLKTLRGHLNRVRAVAFSPDGQMLASSSEDESVRIWDINSGRCLTILQGHSHLVRAIAFNVTNGILVSGSHDLTICVWNAKTGDCLNILHVPSIVWSIAVSPNGKVIASGHDDHTVRLWDADTGVWIRTLEGHEHRVWCVAFNPNGSLLASCGDDQTIRLWDTDSGTCLKTLQGHTNWIRTVSFSPDGSLLASGSHDTTVRIWDIGTAQCARILTGHSNSIWSVVFNPTDGTLASSGDDGSIRIWDVNTGKCLKTLRNEMFYERMNIAHAKGLTGAQKLSLTALGAIEVEP